MNISKIIFVFILATTTLISCKKEIKTEKVAFAISGMTCEIGCAKTIQSKLSKKEGVSDVQVIFKDSIGIVSYDANAISKKEILSYVDGIGGGDLYKTSEIALEKSTCTTKANCSTTCGKEKNCQGKDGKKCEDKKNCHTEKQESDKKA